MDVRIHMTEKQFTLHWCHALRARAGVATAGGLALVRYGSWLQQNLSGLDDAIDDSGEIVLDLQHEQQLRQRGVRADKAFTAAVEAGVFDFESDVRETANALWSVLEEAYASAPQQLKPTGSETNKP